MSAGDAAGRSSWPWAAVWPLFVLTLVSVFNYLDRSLLGLALPAIKAELGSSDTVLGLVSGLAFILFYSILGIPIAWLADRVNRRNIIAVGLAFWSAMTALWSVDAMSAAMKAAPQGKLPASVNGVSIDSRTLQPGDAFFAIAGDSRDGHDFVDAALKNGAGLAVIALCAIGAEAFWIANAMFAGFVLAAVVGGLARVIAYRRGLA